MWGMQLPRECTHPADCAQSRDIHKLDERRQQFFSVSTQSNQRQQFRLRSRKRQVQSVQTVESTWYTTILKTQISLKCNASAHYCSVHV